MRHLYSLKKFCTFCSKSIGHCGLNHSLRKFEKSKLTNVASDSSRLLFTSFRDLHARALKSALQESVACGQRVKSKVALDRTFSFPPLQVQWKNLYTSAQKAKDVPSAAHRSWELHNGIKSKRSPWYLGGSEKPDAWRPIGFCVGTALAAFSGAALLEENRYRKQWQLFKNGATGMNRDSEQTWVPSALKGLYRSLWQEVAPHMRVVAIITALNITVFLKMRKSPSNFWINNFIHKLPPGPTRSVTLLTSNFTHLTGAHLAFNMIAFWSFGSETARMLGPEQFAAFFVTAGLSSGLLSHLGRLRSAGGGFSVGASGAVYACFALAALARPDMKVSLIFFPFFPFEIGSALYAMMTVDLLGCVLGWRRFDHLGHLGGACFGLLYYHVGQKLIWHNAQKLAERVLAAGDKSL